MLYAQRWTYYDFGYQCEKEVINDRDRKVLRPSWTDSKMKTEGCVSFSEDNEERRKVMCEDARAELSGDGMRLRHTHTDMMGVSRKGKICSGLGL